MKKALLIMPLFLLLSVAVGFAVNENLAPEYAKAGQEIGILVIELNSTGSTANTVTGFTINYTGTSSNDVINVTIYNNDALFGYNDTWENNIVSILGSNTIPENVTFNYSVRFLLNLSAIHGNVIDGKIDAITAGENITYITLPFDPTGNTTIDNAPPELYVQQPQTNTSYNYTALSLIFTVADSGAGIDTCWYINVSGTNETLANCNNISFTALPNQLNNITVYANDTLGNENSTQIFFDIDVAVPAISIELPANQTYNYTLLTLNYNVSDAYGTIDECWYINVTGQNVTLTDCANITFTAAPNQQNNITVYVNDTAGNVNSSQVFFIVDITPPTLVIVKPQNNGVYGRNISLEYVVSDPAITQVDSCWYINVTGQNVTLTDCANITFLAKAVAGIGVTPNNITIYVNDTAGNVNYTQIFFNTSVFSLSLNIQNSTFSNLANVSVSVAKMPEPIQGGPPPAPETWSGITDANGNVTVNYLDYTYQGPFTIKIKGYTGSDTENATYIGPMLPPLPKQLLLQFMNGTTVYVVPAANIRITAINRTGGATTFRGMVFDKILNFPIELFDSQNYWLKTVSVPLGRNYSVVVFKIGQEGSPPRSITVTDADLLASNITPTGPYVYNYTFNLTVNLYSLSGYFLNSTGGIMTNMTMNNVNYLYMGRMVPADATIPSDMNDPNNPFILNSTTGWFNIPILGPGDMHFLVAVFANDSSTHYAGFADVNLSANKEQNITLYPLAGNYSIASNLNTSRTTFILWDATNASNWASAGKAHISAVVNYSGVVVNWMLDANESGVFRLPLYDNRTPGSKPITINVYSNRFAPRELKFSPSLLYSNTTIHIPLKSFEMVKPDGSALNVRVYFLVSNSSCDVPNPNLDLRPSGCSLMNMSDDEFNPLKLLSAGKMSVRMVQANGVTIHYKNVDLLASGPPDAMYDDTPVSNVTGATTIEQVWRFGSLGPKIYEKALIGIPYNDSIYNENGSFTMKIRYLYDDDWNVIWNITANGTDELPSDFVDFNTATYRDYLNNTSPMSCSKTNSSATCYVDTTNNMIWMWIPHFSGNAPGPGGSNDFTPPSLTLSVSPSSVTQGGVVTISCLASDPSGISSTALSIQTPGGTTTTASCNSDFTTTGETGTYRVSYTATDTLGNSVSTNTTFTVTSYGGTAPGVERMKKRVQIWSSMAKGIVHKMHITDKDIGFRQISIEVKNKANNVKITVTKLAEKPATIEKEVSGKVYQYIEITKENLEDENIESAKIRFNVTKTWLSNRGFDAEDVSLYRYHNEEWQKLETSKVGEDENEVEYEAITPGFSVFAISAEKAEAVCGNNIKEPGEECDGSDLGGQTCESLGYESGTLLCKDCVFDTSGCVLAAPPLCGNNIKEPGEECDGSDLGGQTCESLGYSGGTLTCTNCHLDTTGCITTVTKPDYGWLYAIIIIIVIVLIFLITELKKKE